MGEYSFYIFALHLPINELTDGALYGFPATTYPGPGLTTPDKGVKMWFLYLGVNILVAAFCVEIIERKGAIFFPRKLQKEEQAVAGRKA